MSDLLEKVIQKDEQEEIKEFISILLVLSKEDRAILLSNANAFKARHDIEKCRQWSVWKKERELREVRKGVQAVLHKIYRKERILWQEKKKR